MEVESFVLEDDGVFPNNAARPLIVYIRAVPKDPVAIEDLFDGYAWPSAWRNGVYPYHHYHSTAHEALGVFSGSATVQLGGEKGIRLEVAAGDVVVIPAGVAHKRIMASSDFRLVGAYPKGQRWDMCYGKPGERPQADQNIAAVPVPKSDPVCGSEGPLIDLWEP
jgi:uncharacterized protein YjlB